MVRWFALAMAGLSGAPSAVEVARGEAHRGAWQQNESDFRYVDDPTVDVGTDGDAVVAWVDQARKDVFLRRYGRDGTKRWDNAVNVSQSGATFSWLPRVSVDRKDPNDVAILWQEIIFSPGGSHGGEIMFARSTDGGRTFTAPSNLSSSKEGDGKGRLTAKEWHNGSLALARDDRGGVYVAWTEYEGALWFRRSNDRGKTFAPRVRVGGDAAAPARAPSLAVAGNAVHLAWAIGENPRADIHVATSTDGGNSFGGARVVGASEGHSDAPTLAVDDNGTVHLAYAESAGGPHAQYDVRYSRRTKDKSEFEAPRSIAGSGNAHFPQLAAAAGRVHLLWDHYEGDGAYPRALLLIQSSDGGATFSKPERVFSSPAKTFSGSQQGLASKLAVSSSGELAIVNSTFRPKQSSEVWLVRPSSGRPGP